MRAQGLPINFIVIAALAILILILAAGFVVAGGGATQRALSPQAAKSSCDSWCGQLQQLVISDPSIDGADDTEVTDSKFCNNTQILDGVAKTCTDINAQCLLTFADGSSAYAECT